MTEFRCLTVDQQGNKNWRRLNAQDEAACIAQLGQKNIITLKIIAGPMGLAERLNQPVNVAIGRRAAGPLEIEQLATLVSAGLPVDRSLDLLREQLASKNERQRYADLLQAIRGGDSLAVAMGNVGGYPKWALGIIAAAQAGGDLGGALTSVAERMEREQSVKTRLVTALTYPAAVLISTILALIIVLTIVVPQFAPIFEGEEERLPQLTRAVLWLSNNIGQYGWAAGLIMILLIAASIAIILSPNPEVRRNAKKLLPGMKMRDQYIAAQYIGLLATLVANGVRVVKALPLARDGLSSQSWEKEMSLVEKKVREGTRLSDAFAQSSLFPTTAARLVEVGERSGSLADTLLQASNIMGNANTARIERIVSLVNPIAIILLGAIVALLVAGVMLGIFSLGDFAG
jgi:type II secretory pathway component PulF